VSGNNKLELLKLKAATYQPCDWQARIRTLENSIGNFPVHLNAADGLAYIKWYGEWQLAESIPGFERFEEVKPLPTKKLYDPFRGTLVDTGIPVAEYEFEKMFGK